MKITHALFLLCCCLLTSMALAQAPKGINYQGVARDAEGKPLSQKEISIRISVLNGSADGPVEYDEVHEVRTNSFGLFTLVIGQGTAGTGSFTFISWAAGDKWLQIELDENGGRNFKLMGSQQLMSVPYALYAEYAGNSYQAGQGINISNNMISNTGDQDNNPQNELITGMTLTGDQKLQVTDAAGTHEVDLSGIGSASQNLAEVLTEGNDASGSVIANVGTPLAASDAATKAYVDAHADADANAINEAQTLSKTGATISLTNVSGAGGGSVVLNDDSNTNEAQTISRTGTDVTLTQANGAGGGTFSVNDADANATNEAQTLSKTGSTISLTNVSGAGGGSVNLNDDSNTNEAQTISRTGTDVTLTQANGAGGGTFSVNDADADASNEIQDLNQVLTEGNDAGGNRITNLGEPTASQDAATRNYVDAADANLANQISTTYAFKTNFNYTNSSGLIENNIIMPFGTEEFDDFNVLGANSFVANENGTYVFVVDGVHESLLGAGAQLSLLYNSVKYPFTIIPPWGGGAIARFNTTLMFKLTAGESVRLVADNILIGGTFAGRFFGFKL